MSLLKFALDALKSGHALAMPYTPVCVFYVDLWLISFFGATMNY